MQKEPQKNLWPKFAEKCQRFNLKVTPQRMAIYRELVNSVDHPTADAMYQLIKREFPNISFDTVNRTLLTFAQIGLVDLVEVYGGAKRFDPNTATHHHLHCVTCGKIVDFFNDDYTNLEIPNTIQQRFHVLNSRVVLKGFCEQCSKQGKMIS